VATLVVVGALVRVCAPNIPSISTAFASNGDGWLSQVGCMASEVGLVWEKLVLDRL
jgi:hypothetical protein